MQARRQGGGGARDPQETKRSTSWDRKILNPIFRLGFFGRPWTGEGHQMPPLHFLKTIKDIDVKLTPLIKCCEINLLLLSYLSCDVTKAPSWIFMVAILDFRNLSKRCQSLFFRFKFVE